MMDEGGPHPVELPTPAVAADGRVGPFAPSSRPPLNGSIVGQTERDA